MNDPKTDVLIIGAGIIGLTLAYELSMRGVRVSVIDQFEPGEGCSYGNAGWITPCLAQPLPMPGLFLQAFKWLLNPVSPLYIKPEANWFFIQWLTRFLRSMNQKMADRSVAALVEMSTASLTIYRQWATKQKLSFHLEEKGLLFLAHSAPMYQSALAQMRLMAAHGISGQSMNGDEIKTLVPAAKGDITGGVFFSGQAHAEPLDVVRAVAAAATQNGVRIISGVEVFDFQTTGRQIQAVQTTRGPFSAEKTVLAVGSWSHALGQKLKLKLPVLGGKGYAVTFRSEQPVIPMPIFIVDKKIALTPRQNGIRVAGTLELVNQNFSITARRLQAILHGAQESIRMPDNTEVIEIWRGLRPCTPDGVPIIDFSSAYQNLFVTTGHQMLGLQTAPGSAKLAADLLTGAAPSFDPSPFRINRF